MSQDSNDAGEECKEDLLIEDFVVPAHGLTAEESEAQRKDECDAILQQISEQQRKRRVEYLRSQMEGSLHNLRESVDSAIELESDSCSDDQGESSTRAGASLAVESPNSRSSYELESPVVRFPARRNTMVESATPPPNPPLGPSSSMVPPPFHSRSRGGAPAVAETMSWEFPLPTVPHFMDSKLFFFSSILWKVTFGVNYHLSDLMAPPSSNARTIWYYIFITPVEQLHSDFQMMCRFVIHSPGTSNGLSSCIPDYCVAATDVYHFPHRTAVTRGIEKFIGPEVSKYVTAQGTLRMSIVMSATPRTGWAGGERIADASAADR